MSDIDPEKLGKAIASLEDIERSFGLNCRERLLLAAARAHLATLPRFKEVEVWRVEFAGPDPATRTFRSCSEANIGAAHLAAQGNVSCIRVTGPHKQRVPA